MIGAGVFAAIGPAAAAAGSGLLIGLAIAAAIAFANATSSAQLAAVYLAAGGTYLYGRERLMATTWVWSGDPAPGRCNDRNQRRRSLPKIGPGVHRPGSVRIPATLHQPGLRCPGLMHCGVCGRRMQGQTNHDRPYYRCRFPTEYGVSDARHPRNLYVKESSVLPGLDGWLASLFNEDRIDLTCQILAGVSEPDADEEARRTSRLEQIADCDRRMGQYQAVLDEGADPKIVAKWMAAVLRERQELEAFLGRDVPGAHLTASQIRVLVKSLREIVSVLAEADPDERAELYNDLGVNLTYHPEGRVTVQMKPPWGQSACRRTDTSPNYTTTPRQNIPPRSLTDQVAGQRMGPDEFASPHLLIGEDGPTLLADNKRPGYRIGHLNTLRVGSGRFLAPLQFHCHIPCQSVPKAVGEARRRVAARPTLALWLVPRPRPGSTDRLLLGRNGMCGHPKENRPQAKRSLGICRTHRYDHKHVIRVHKEAIRCQGNGDRKDPAPT